MEVANIFDETAKYPTAIPAVDNADSLSHPDPAHSTTTSTLNTIHVEYQDRRFKPCLIIQ
eukprot:scaffold18296_cov38-Attheya_sp.AAC.2